MCDFVKKKIAFCFLIINTRKNTDRYSGENYSLKWLKPSDWVHLVRYNGMFVITDSVTIEF